MEKSLDEMNQQELTEFMNGPNTKAPGVMPLGLDDDPEDHVRRVSRHVEATPEERTVEDWAYLMNDGEYLNNGVVDLSKER